MNFLTGFSLKDAIYGGIIIALISGGLWFIHHERSIGAAEEVAAVQRASAKVQAAAEKKIIAQTKQYKKAQTQDETTYETNLSLARTQRDSDRARLERLLHRQADRCSTYPVLRGSPSEPAPQSQVRQGAEGSESLSGALGSDAVGLAKAVRDLSASLEVCEAERSALTGK